MTDENQKLIAMEDKLDAVMESERYLTRELANCRGFENHAEKFRQISKGLERQINPPMVGSLDKYSAWPSQNSEE